MDIPPSPEEYQESKNRAEITTNVSRKKSRIRNLIFAVLAGMATFSIVGKPWPEPKPLPRERTATKSLAREVFTPEKTGGLLNRVYDRRGELIFEEHSKNMTSLSKHMFHNGKPFGLYLEEKEKNPDLTPEEYIAFLAEALDSHEKLHVFFKEFWRYAEDSSDRNDPLKEGTDGNFGDYAQKPIETAARIKNRRMIGDCEDLALFSYAIIAQQPNHNPHIISRGDHVYTAWIEEREYGGFDAFSIDSTLECNGDFYNPARDNDCGKYSSPTDALVTLLISNEPTSSTYYKILDTLNQPPYVIWTMRPVVLPGHETGILRLVPAQAFHPKYPFLWSYDEIYLTITAAAVTGTMIKKWRKKRKKKNVNQT